MTTLTRMVTRLATLLAVSQLGAASRPAQFPGGVIGPEGENLIEDIILFIVDSIVISSMEVKDRNGRPVS